MNIKFSYDEKFTKFLEKLKTKYGEEIFALEGINGELDINGFSKKLYSKGTVADASVDGNANVSEFSPAVYINELTKPFLRMNSFYILWKQLRLLYNNDIAEDIIEKQINGTIYINDFHLISAKSPYCFNFSALDLVKSGLPFIHKIKSVPAKHLYSFKSQLEQFIVFASNNIAGATGIADLFVIIGWYVERILGTMSDAGFQFKRKEDVWKYVEETIVSFIYTVNQPFRAGIQCLSEDTKILTKNGWKNYKDVSKGDTIYTFNMDSKTLELKPVRRMFKKQYKGVMYNLKNRIQDQLITPQHNIVRKKFNSPTDKYVLEPIENVLKLKSPIITPISCNNNIEDYNISDSDIKLLAWIISEGHFSKNGPDNRLIISQSEIRNKDNYTEIIKLLDTHRFNYTITTHKGLGLPSKNMRIGAKDSKIFVKHYFKDRNIKKIPEWMYNLSQKQAKMFIDTYMKGDGCIDRIITTDKQILNGLEILAIKAGYGITSRIKSIKHNKLSKKQQYVIRLIKHNNTHINSIKKVNYNGIVWCPNTENGTVIAKRNGTVFITGNSPFTNVSIYDDFFLGEMCKDYVFPDGKHANKDIVKRVQKSFLQVMNKELSRTPVTFPVTTACFAVDKDKNIKDESFLKMIVEQNKKFGFINMYCGDTSVLSSCCRLRSEKDNPYFNSFGGASSTIGSLGVCTLNLPHIAFETKDKNKFLTTVRKNVEVAARVNHAKRMFIKKGILDGFLPLYTYGFMNLSKQYSTVGLNGINEALEILGLDIVTEEGQKFTEQLLTIINNENDEYQDKYDSPHNVEQVPSEQSAIKLAKKDKILGLNDKYVLYSNQFIPLTKNADLLDRIHIQGKFDSMFSGGAIVHLNVEQEISDDIKMAKLIRYAAKNGVIYFAINYNLQQCKDGHMSIGIGKTCVICGKKVVGNFTRVVGFLVNTKNWAKERREYDYPNRVWYK